MISCAEDHEKYISLPRGYLDDVGISIGQMGGGKRRLTGQIDVSMIQSLSRKDSVDNIIVDDVLMAMEESQSPILLTECKEHLELLHDRLKGFVRHIIILRGGRSAKERREVKARAVAGAEDHVIALLFQLLLQLLNLLKRGLALTLDLPALPTRKTTS